VAETLAAGQAETLTQWGYTDFGPPGTVVADTTEPLLGVRKLTFANGLRLSLRKTDLQQDRIAVELNIDGGQMLNTRDDPLATAMDNALPIGGLGKHSIDDLQTILAGSSVGFGFNADAETFVFASQTTPRDLELQLQLDAAALSDPGFRPEGEAQYRRSIENFFASRDATAESALGNASGAILSDNDPRFTIQPKEKYLALTFAELRHDIGDRLAHGALELALVGDFDEQAAIDLVARTLGALPAREPQFRDYADNKQRGFTADRTRRTVYHDGGANQAIVRFSWPTRDDSDFDDELRLELLESVMRLELLDTLREKLGQTYSPGVNASESDVYPGWGVFTISASVDTSQVEATRKAMLDTVAALVAAPVEADVLLRARQPMLEAYDNALKTNQGWMNLVERAQRRPDRIGRFVSGKDRLAALTPEDVRAIAARYLAPAQRLEIVALPRNKPAQ
jgi:zinc protease